MNIKLNARLIALTLALLLVVGLLVYIVALHTAHSITWQTFVLSPNVFNHNH